MEKVLSVINSEGAYSQVWKAKYFEGYRSVGIDVAVKIISTTDEATLVGCFKEVGALKELEHESVIKIYGACISQGEIWIVMEFADGGSLFNLLNKPNEPLPWPRKWELAIEAAQAIAFLHSKNIIHRDIKSLNFLIAGERVKLSDFGMASHLLPATTASATISKQTTTSKGEALGTVRWQAPETIGSKPQWTTKADVYSLGMTLWEIAAQQVPFNDIADNTQILFMVKYEELRPDEPDCPKDFAEIMKSCWNQQAQSRPTAREVLELLQEGNNASLNPISLAEVTMLPTKRKFQVLSFPRDVQYDPNQKYLYAVTYGNYIERYDFEKGDFTQLKGPWGINPKHLAFSVRENILFINCGGTWETDNQIFKMDRDGRVSVFAGTPARGHKDGSGTEASFFNPTAMAVNESTGDLYVAEESHTIRKITPQGEVTTLAGKAQTSGFADGIGENVLFNSIQGLCIYCECLYISDAKNHKIRKMDLKSGLVSTIAGSESGFKDGPGELAQFDGPYGIAYADTADAIIVADVSNHRIRKIVNNDGAYTVSTLAGSGYAGQRDGYLLKSHFNYPFSVCMDNVNHICYVADQQNNCIRRFPV